MTNSTCNGIVTVQTHTRNGFQVDEYTRKCGRHNPNADQEKLSNIDDSIDSVFPSNNKSLSDKVDLSPKNINKMRSIIMKEMMMEIQTALPPELLITIEIFNSLLQLANVLGIGNFQESEAYQLYQLLNEMGLIPQMGVASTIGMLDDPVAAAANVAMSGILSDGELVSKAFEMLVKNENSIPYPYYDTAGNITVGMGINVENRTIFDSINWLNRDGILMNENEKDTLYKTLQNAKEGFNFNTKADKQFVNGFADISLKESNRLSLKYIENTIKEVRSTLKSFDVDFDKMAEKAKLGVIDMHYNLGDGKFRKFIKLMDALRRGDYYEAARECHRKGISEDRNLKTRRLFEEAAIQ